MKPGEILDANNIWVIRPGDIIQNNNGRYMVLGLHSMSIDGGEYIFSILEEDGTPCNMVGEPEKIINQFGPYVYVCSTAKDLGKSIKAIGLGVTVFGLEEEY